MFTCISEPFHIWEGTGGDILISHEGTKHLRSFPDVQQAVNALYLEGNKTVAGKLNHDWKHHVQQREESRQYHKEAARNGRFTAAPYDRD